MNPALDPAARALIRLALREDGTDVTTRCLVPRGARLAGYLVARQSGVLCGMAVAREVFRLAAPRSSFIPLARDGSRVRPGRRIARVLGPRELLSAERPALNFLQRLSGIATLTRAFADRLRGSRARLFDTRKTAPGWRTLEKYAVRCGGGFNHRMSLHDMAMLKDNHWPHLDGPRRRAAFQRTLDAAFPRVIARAHFLAAGLGRPHLAELPSGIRELRRRRPRLPLLIEAENRSQIERALACGADILVLDNMTPRRLRREIRFIRTRSPRTRIEVSGGITLENIRSIARLGPDRISVGRITHSAPSLDISLELRRSAAPQRTSEAGRLPTNLGRGISSRHRSVTLPRDRARSAAPQQTSEATLPRRRARSNAF